MVRIPGFQCHSLVSIPDQGTEIPQATWHSQKKKKYKKVKNKLEVITEKNTGEKELKVKTDSFPSFFFFLCKICLEFFSLEDQCSGLYEGDG